METPCPTGRCKSSSRCADCIERDRIYQMKFGSPPVDETMTKQNSGSIVRTLFGRLGRRR